MSWWVWVLLAVQVGLFVAWVVLEYRRIRSGRLVVGFWNVYQLARRRESIELEVNDAMKRHPSGMETP